MSHIVLPRRLPEGPEVVGWHLGEGWGQTTAIMNIAQPISSTFEQYIVTSRPAGRVKLCHVFVFAPRA